jgi:hypothetical protein
VRECVIRAMLLLCVVVSIYVVYTCVTYECVYVVPCVHMCVVSMLLSDMLLCTSVCVCE